MHLKVVNDGIIGKHEALQEIEVPLGDPRNAKLTEAPWQRHVQSNSNATTEGLTAGELGCGGSRRLHLLACSVQSRSLPWSRPAQRLVGVERDPHLPPRRRENVEEVQLLGVGCQKH